MNKKAEKTFDLAQAVWSNRQDLLDCRDRLAKLRELVDSPRDLTMGQWLQLYAVAKSYSPDLIIELGRGYGNSTCAFTEAANSMENTHVVSVGINGGWASHTLPKLRNVVSGAWFDKLTVLRSDIRDVNFKEVLGPSRRVLFFWDAHGHDLAAFLLSEVLPQLSSRDHLVAVHDVADTRYEEVERRYTREDGLPTYWAGPFVSAFPELIYIYDFISRNGITAGSPPESIEQWRKSGANPTEELDELDSQFGSDSPLREGGWIYFDLSRASQYPDRSTLLDRYDPRADPPLSEPSFRFTPRFILGTAKRLAISALRRESNRD